MEATVTKEGNILVETSLGTLLGVKEGDKLRADIQDGSIVLTPEPKRKYKTRIINDPISGLPVLDSGPDAPILTNEMVRELLSDFP